MTEQTWIRRGKVMIDPEGIVHDHKSINAAKKVSLALFKKGVKVRAEAVRRASISQGVRVPKGKQKKKGQITWKMRAGAKVRA